MPPGLHRGQGAKCKNRIISQNHYKVRGCVMASQFGDVLTWDKHATKEKVETMLRKVADYRNFGEVRREASMIQSYELREGQSGGGVSKPTENIATYNVDSTAYAKRYDGLLEKMMRGMSKREKYIINEKYLNPDKKKDVEIACEMNLGTSQYNKIKTESLMLIASVLRLNVLMIPCDGCENDSSRKDLIRGLCKKCRAKESGN